MSFAFATGRVGHASIISLACIAIHAAPAFAQEAPGAAGELAAARLEAKALSERAHAAAALDTTPPVLHSISLSGSVNAQTGGQSIAAAINLTDNLSGVAYYYVELRSPSGTQYITRFKRPPAPNTNVNSTLTVGLSPYSSPAFSTYSEPGTWTADYLYAYDANGNGVSYSQSQLAALGNTSFTVTNTGGYDIVAPVLASGTITTPTTRLSKPPKGTAAGTLPYVSADISITDAGNGRVSGAYYGYMYFCLSNGAGGCADYIYMSGQTNAVGKVANTLTVGTQLRSDQIPGSYQLYYVYLQDVAGNTSVKYSTLDGGDTDFRDYFPVTTVFVNQ